MKEKYMEGKDNDLAKQMMPWTRQHLITATKNLIKT